VTVAGVDADPVPTSEDRMSFLRTVLTELQAEPQWSVRSALTAGFVARELGVTLALPASPWPALLHVEVRFARDVRNVDAAVRFCAARNHVGLLGRWVFDPVARVVALVADIPAGVGPWGPGVAAAVVAELVGVAEAQAYTSAAEREIGAATALTLVGGRRRPAPHPVCEHLARVVRPQGASPHLAGAAVVGAQDGLIVALPHWYVTHGNAESSCEDPEGSIVVLRAACHPYAGWGVMVALTPPEGVAGGAGPRRLAALNQAEADRALTGPAPGSWSGSGGEAQYRAFLSAAVLARAEAGGNVFAPADLLRDVVRAAAARAEEIWENAGRPALTPVLHRPGWPGDERAAALDRGARSGGLPESVRIWSDPAARLSATDPEGIFSFWDDPLTDGSSSDH
jgi:hypothetical protein